LLLLGRGRISAEDPKEDQMQGKDNDRVNAVYSQVAAALEAPNVRELWERVRTELAQKGGGPDACVTYLESELERLKLQIQRELDSIAEPNRE
jgi:hypothetical protein